jgi:uncharacterized protein (UPF0371 family)
MKRNLNPRYTNVVVVAMQLDDGTIITGRSSRRMVAAAAAILNAAKKMSGIADEIHLIAPSILERIQNLKTELLQSEKSSLNCEEVLTALTISATTNPTAEAALNKIAELRGCKAHCTAILSDKDEKTLKGLGIDVTSDHEYVTNNLYYS